MYLRFAILGPFFVFVLFFPGGVGSSREVALQNAGEVLAELRALLREHQVAS